MYRHGETNQGANINNKHILLTTKKKFEAITSKTFKLITFVLFLLIPA